MKQLFRLIALVLLLFPVTALSAKPQAAKTVVVASDGSGDFETVQAAIDAVPDGNKDHIVIHIKPGTYKERVTIPKEKSFVTLRGDDAKTTILTWHWNAKQKDPASSEGKEVGTSGSYSTLVSADDFVAENITFENTAGDTGQAVALRTNGQRQAFFNCRMIGWQDTLYLHNGRAYFADCHIEGRVDFIFGRAVAVFERCTIKSKNGGYVTAAATEPTEPNGYVFLDCKLVSDDNVPTFLGRPWRPHASVAFVRCELGEHIRPEGWDNWRKAENEKTARYYEYQCTGPGADRSKRVAWSKELTAEQAKDLTPQKVLAGTDAWNPVSQ
jgi:pectinesterase